MSEDRVLKDIFVVPPISVLDVKQKYWKDRRRHWQELSLGAKGRDENLLNLSSLLRKKQKSTSLFDPVLAEIMYLWFSREDDLVYDPFCGGVTRGLVASKSKRKYVGVDIREEQIESNIEDIKMLCEDYVPYYQISDAAEINFNEEFKYDLFFTCPPYYDLEKYSSLDGDLSNMDYKEFDCKYKLSLIKSLKHLEDDRFASIVVGDVRGEDGNYLGLIQKTIDIFKEAGLNYYNDMILLQEPATAAMRAYNYMNSSRKIAKCHQNVLVFIKGDAKKATERLNKF